MSIEISVIIITYNMGRLIERALDSLRNQTVNDFEVIVVDNYSTDNTKDVICQYSDMNLKYVKINNEGILSKSRNLGISVAIGEWIAFLDADDYWEPNKVEVLLRTITDLTKEFVAVSHRCYREYIADGRREIINCRVPKNNLYKELLMKKNPFCLSGMTIRKNALELVGFFSENPKYKAVEDYELWIRLSKIGSFYNLQEPLGTITLHDENYSKKADVQMQALDIMKKSYIESEKSLDARDKKIAYKHLYEVEMRCLQKGGFYDEAIKVSREASKKKVISLRIIVAHVLAILKISRF